MQNVSWLRPFWLRVRTRLLSNTINILVYELALAKINKMAGAKAAIGLLVKGFASEVGRFGVRVNAIAPGIVETALTTPFKERPDIHALYTGHTVFNRWSRADEVATAVAYLASDAASYVSGSTL